MKSLLKSILWILLYIFIQVLCHAPVFIKSIQAGIKDTQIILELMSQYELLIPSIGNIIFVLIVIFILKAKNVHISKQWKLHPVPARRYILPSVISFTYSLFFALISYNPLEIKETISQASNTFGANLALFLFIISLIIVAPISEEILFRGLIFNELKNSYKHTVTIIISSLFFAVFHPLSIMIGAFIMGILLALIYEKTDSLFVPIVAHAVGNLPDLILYRAPVLKKTMTIVLAITFLIICLIAFILWFKMNNRASEDN